MPAESAGVFTRWRALGARIVGIGIEQLLAVDLVIGDRLLSLRRNQPVDEGLAELLFDMRVLLGVHQYHAVLVEKPLLALARDGEAAAVLERHPGAATRHPAYVGRRRGVESRVHA